MLPATSTRGGASSGDRGLDGAVLLDAGKDNVAIHADAFGRNSASYNIPAYPYLNDPTRAFGGRQPNSAARSFGESLGGSYFFDGGYAGLAVSQINSLYHIPGIDGEDHKGILNEVQFHPVKDNVLHVDFLEVHAEKPIVMGVPIAPQGLAEGVRAGGRLITMVRKLNVKALYSAIPEKLNIDVTALQLGKSIKVGDLHFENLELVTPKEVIVCTVKMTRAAMGAAAAAAKA